MLANLTPGDFAVVRKSVSILGQLGDTTALARMLEAESAAKPEVCQPFGFLRAPKAAGRPAPNE